VAGGEAMVHVLQEVAALEVGRAGDGVLPAQPAPRPGLVAPEPAQVLAQAGRAPVTLPDVLVMTLTLACMDGCKNVRRRAGLAATILPVDTVSHVG
jgi:hypothetical protein